MHITSHFDDPRAACRWQAEPEFRLDVIDAGIAVVESIGQRQVRRGWFEEQLETARCGFDPQRRVSIRRANVSLSSRGRRLSEDCRNLFAECFAALMAQMQRIAEELRSLERFEQMLIQDGNVAGSPEQGDGC